jgi:integrase
MAREMHTVNEMFDRYAKERLPNLSARTKIDYGRHINKLREAFGAKDVTALTRKEIVDFMNVPKGKIQRNRMLAVLSAAYTEALLWEWVEGNPCSLIERHKPKQRDRRLTEEEFQAARNLVAKAPVSGWRLALVMDLARYTGQLQSDVTSLRWSQINDEEGTILFRHRITRKKVTVMITPELRAVLDRAKQRSGKSQYLVTTRLGTPYTSEGIRAMWQRFLQRKWRATGNDPFTFHDIRRLACEAHTAKQVRETEDSVAAYPQFDAVVRAEATEMAKHYKVFYCLELSIRKLIAGTMEKAYGRDWWNSGKVEQQIKQEVDNLMSKEIDSGMTQRSERELDYTTFGQLSQIIVQNWDVFDKALKSRNAVRNVMASLNRIRGPIAHFSPMSEREVKRLQLTVEDWFSILL